VKQSQVTISIEHQDTNVEKFNLKSACCKFVWFKKNIFWLFRRKLVSFFSSNGLITSKNNSIEL